PAAVDLAIVTDQAHGRALPARYRARAVSHRLDDVDDALDLLWRGALLHHDQHRCYLGKTANPALAGERSRCFAVVPAAEDVEAGGTGARADAPIPRNPR